MTSLFRNWPVRWRIAAVSAGLTLIILMGFALIVGKLVSDRLEADFEEEVQSNAHSIATAANAWATGDTASISQEERKRFVDVMNGRGDGFVRFVDADGDRIAISPDGPDFGPPQPGEVIEFGDYLVATAQAQPTSLTASPVFVQYAESRTNLDATIGRLWLFLGLGVLGGAALALLAGLAVANRAMQPIAGLTAAAREIAMTRDPSVRLPQPETDDEVAELARTLEQMLRELDAARSEREQMIQAQRDFVADASHELRTPLTSILANLELLEERLAREGDDPESEEIVAGALGSSRRMRRLVNDLLLLARADAGRAGPRRDCDLAAIAEDALAEIRPVADGHELRADIDGPIPLEGNPDDLHRLIANLLENAIKHTPRGTTVELVARARNGRAELVVADDGPGLPEGAGDQIFARFVRGNGAPSDVTSGTGLGLAIVKAVAVSHGGDVRAGRSQAGGAEFVVELPLAHDQAEVTPAPAAA